MKKELPDSMAENSGISWLRPIEAGAGPRYLQIVSQLVDALNGGVLQAGDRLPAQRELAKLLGVDLTTVTRAYAEARQRGVLEASGSRGSFIAHADSDIASIDLSMNIPPALKKGRLNKLIQEGIGTIMQRADINALMTYHVGPGIFADRFAATLWLKPVLSELTPQQIIICSGAQAAIAALIFALTQPGDTILTEPLTYPGLIAAAQRLGRKIITVETDHDGMMPDALDRAITEHSASVVYVVPTIQNPTSTTMSGQRRKDIVRVVERHKITVIEDDPYWLLAGDAPPPLFTLTTKTPIYYLSTLSKCLSPGLRTAYLVTPQNIDSENLLNALRSVTLMVSPLMVSLSSLWIQNGIAGELLGELREEIAARQTLARSILPATLQAHPYGLHQWLPLPQHWGQHNLVHLAQQNGFGVTAADAFSPSGKGPDAIRISLGGAADRAQLIQALRKLSSMLHEKESYTGTPNIV